MAHVIVVGGGISGLAAAHHLLRSRPGIDVTLLEADERLGGKIHTVRDGDYVLEAGPDSMLGVKPRGVGLSREIGLGDRLTGPIEVNRRSFVYRGGRLHRIPEGLTGLVPTRLGPMARTGLISPLGKLRMLGDWVLRPARGDDDVTLADFMTRRLGREVYGNLIEPLMAGIYAGDGSQLSLQATFPQLQEAVRRHGGLIRGVLAQRAMPSSVPSGALPVTPRPGFVTYPTGLHEVIDTLADAISAAGGTIRTGAAVEGIDGAGAGFVVRTGDEALHAEAVILATPAWAAAELLAPLDAAAAGALAGIPHVSTAIVAVGFDDPAVARRLAGFGYVVPRAERRPVLAMTWLSSKWAGRAPEGKALVRAFVGRAGQQEVLTQNDDALVALVRSELAEVLGITAEPELTRVFRWDRGMPQYTMGHLDRLATLETRLARMPKLAVAGNMYRGVGLPDCIASGETAAERVLADLSSVAGRNAAEV